MIAAAWLPALGALLLAQPPAWEPTSSERPAAEQVADRFLAALERNDEAAFDAFTAVASPDAFLVVDALLERGRLDAAGRFAARAAHWLRGAALPALVARARDRAPADREREERLRAALRVVEAAYRKRDWAGGERAAREAKDDLDDEARPGVPAAMLRLRAAEAHQAQGRHEAAAAAYRRAAATAAALGWIAAQGRWLHYAGSSFWYARRFEESRQAEEEALALLERIEDRTLTVDALLGLGLAHKELGDRARAREHYDRARALTRALADSRPKLQRLSLLAMSWGDLDDWAAGIEASEAALALAERFCDDDRRAWCLLFLGRFSAALGRYDRALDSFDRALRLPGFRPPAAALTMLGVVYAELHQVEEAIECFTRAIPEFEERGERASVARAVANLGVLHSMLDENDRAAGLLERARRINREIGDRRMAANTLLNLGMLHGRGGRPEEARRAFEEALGELDGVGSRMDLALARANLGEALVELGDAPRARRLLQASLRDLEAAGERRPLAAVWAGLARLELQAGDEAAARAAARRALELRLPLGRGLGEAGRLALRDEERGASDLGLSASGGAEAFWFAEAGRALVLLDQVVNRKAFLEAELPEELLRGHDQAQARVEAARRRLYASWDGRAGRPELESAREALEEAEREFGRALGRIQREVRRAAGVVYPEPIGLAACQAALPARTALVLFQLTPAEAYALVVRPDAFHLERLGPSRELAAGVEAWLEFTAGRAEEEPALAARLYDRLLRPLEPRLEGVERLLIAPDGPLAFLDPGALLRGDERAIERWQIDFWPSATVGVALLQEDRKRPRGAGLLALADPVYEPAAAGPGPFARERGGSRTGPLPGTAAEVRAIAELFPEDRRVVLLREHATADALRDALRRFDGPPAAVHLACHGLIHGSRPGRIGLELSHHQALTVDDLHRMDLPADLAVLSACETGKGPLRRGEGVLGLVRGFFFAGCPRVVVSNWRVPDEGTRELMVDFYSRMLQGGLPPGAALRAAKRALSRARAHPYHWAAFVLWGLPD